MYRDFNCVGLKTECALCGDGWVRKLNADPWHPLSKAAYAFKNWNNLGTDGQKHCEHYFSCSTFFFPDTVQQSFTLFLLLYENKKNNEVGTVSVEWTVTNVRCGENTIKY